MTRLRHLSKEITFYRSILGSPFNWSSAVKRRKRLGSALVRLLFLIRGRVTQGFVGVCFVFATRCTSIVRNQGESGLASYLKVCYVILQKELGEDHLVDLTILKTRVSRTRKGLPRIIPVVHRNEIRSGNTVVIRLWLTLFGLYRVLEGKRRLNMGTITNPFTGDTTTIPSLVSFIPTFLEQIRQQHGGRRIDFSTWQWDFDLDPILKTSPTGRALDSKLKAVQISSSNVTHDVGVWKHHPALWAKLLRWFELIGAEDLVKSLRLTSASVKRAPSEWIGKFGFKEEPGKVRVFAMVDYLTQVALKPLHKVIFKVLKPIRTDGTFDQWRPLNELITRFPNSEMWSFDLSAATDRLPLVVQKELLAEWLSPELAQLWASLLVDRSYYVSESAQEEYWIERSFYKYAVGQPMGAYSSWGMLALTHHLIVQFCARSVGRKTAWFDAYCVLGDDIVIADKAVADKYLEVMKGLGVGVGIAKSILQARGTCEFAKKFIFKTSNCSPLSFAAFGIAQSNLSVMDMLAQSAKAIYPDLTIKAVLRSMGIGYKLLGDLPGLLSTKNRFASFVLFLTRPGGCFERPFLEWVFGTWDGWMPFTSRDRSRAMDWLLKAEFVNLQKVYFSPRPAGSMYCQYGELENPILLGFGGPKLPKGVISDLMKSSVQQKGNMEASNISSDATRILLDWRHWENNPQGLLEILKDLQLRAGEVDRLKTRVRLEAKAPNQTRLLKQLWGIRHRMRTKL